MNEEFDILKQVVTLLDNKKANDMVVLNVANQTILTSYFVIVTGNASTQVRALADEVVEKMKDRVEKVEGKDASGWIIIDLGGVMVHVFSRQMRDFYSLEHLWEGAEKINHEELIDKGDDEQ